MPQPNGAAEFKDSFAFLGKVFGEEQGLHGAASGVAAGIARIFFRFACRQGFVDLVRTEALPMVLGEC